MAPVNITIDGRKLQAQAGQTVYEAAAAAGIEIPILCHHPALPPEGACRVCVVEIEKQRNLQTACTYPVAEGMVISTRSPRVMEARKFALELIVSDHPLDCMTCEATGDCRLQDLAYEYQVRDDVFAGGRQHSWPIDDPNPFIQVDRNKCILCRRCVRACDYINGVEAISIVHRGFDATIAFGMDSTMEDSPCEFCGSCVEVCPVAALWPKQSIGKGRAYQLKQVETVCSYCGVGCKVILHVKDNEIVKVTGADGAANHGFTCVKGRFGYDYVNHADRLRKPLMRRYLVEGGAKPALHQPNNGNGRGEYSRAANPAAEWVEVSWEQALDTVATRLAQTKEAHGGDAFAALCSARCTNEENYLMMKLARQVMQTHNIDHCARL
ncbi:MAG: putative formate dehydrogenase [Chloroflexi bacterium ADurb.Bin325]|nr:MAG: putative formate dehydrogenase [Chloroflexi bacterium ADurb.Bin325]